MSSIFFAYEHHWFGLDLAGVSQTDARLRFYSSQLSDRKIARLDISSFIALIFSYFRIPTTYQHRVLYWESSARDHARRDDPCRTA